VDLPAVNAFMAVDEREMEAGAKALHDAIVAARMADLYMIVVVICSNRCYKEM